MCDVLSTIKSHLGLIRLCLSSDRHYKPIIFWVNLKSKSKTKIICSTIARCSKITNSKVSGFHLVMMFLIFYKHLINDFIISWANNSYNSSCASLTNPHTFVNSILDMQDIMLLCNCILLWDGITFCLLMLLSSIQIGSLNILFVIMKFFSSKIYVLFWK